MVLDVIKYAARNPKNVTGRINDNATKTLGNELFVKEVQCFIAS